MAGSGQAAVETANSPGHSLREVVYTPDSALRRPHVLLAGMFRDYLSSRELAWRLFVRNTQAQHRQSLLGYLWVLMPPIASTLLFAFLHSQKILNVGVTDIPYPAYVLTGMVLWETFTASLNSPIEMVSGSSSMLTKLNFPREALILTSFYHVLFNLTVKLVLLVAVFVWFDISVPTTILFAPLGMLSLIAFGFMLGLLLVPLGALYQDVGRALTMLLSAWFLVTPVVYPPPQSWPACLVTQVNPVTPLLLTTREMITTGHLSYLPGFLMITATTVMLLLAGWVIYRLALPHLISRMSA